MSDVMHHEPFAPPEDAVDAQALLANAKRIQGHATALVEEVGAALHGARAFVEASVERHPVATLSAAAGAGFVVAGGLSSSLSRFALRTGAKLATAWAIKRVTEVATGASVKLAVEPIADGAGGAPADPPGEDVAAPR